MQRIITLSGFLTFCLSVFLFGFGTSYAQTPVVHIVPKPSWVTNYKSYDKKPAARTIRDGYFYDLSEQQIHIEKKAEYIHYEREIVSSTGIQNGSQISVSFDPAYQRLDFHDITVWRNNKPQNRLKLSAFKILADEADFSKFIYQGSYSANVILDDIRKGDKIEYSFTITGTNPIFGNRFCKEVYLQGTKYVAHQYINLVASSEHKLNMKLFNKAPNPAITKSNGLVCYTWENFLVTPIAENDNAPSWYNPYQYVMISDFANWNEVTNWALSINEPDVNVKGNLAALVNDLKAKCGNNKAAYFREAVRIVQDEVRYMGIEIGEYSHRANRPQKVYDQRYGDCKDKSLLLVSILKAGGIDAHMVLVNSDLNDKIDQFIPTASAFDHAVVVATINGKDTWVDATISNQGGDGTDIYFPDYGKGLVLKPGNTGLTTIPVPKSGKIICEEKYTGGKSDTSKVNFDVKTIYTLDQADKERDKLASSGTAETEKDYLDYYSKIYAKIEAGDSIRVIDDIHKNILTTVESYRISNFYKRDSVSGRARADFYANSISEQLPTVSSQIKSPIAVNYPYDLDYTIKMVSTGGWNIEERRNDINRDAYRFSSDYSAAGDTLSLHYKLTYLKDNVKADKVDEFKKDVSDLKEGSGLSYSIDFPLNNPPFILNTWLAIFALILAAIIVYLAIRIYHSETPGIVFSKGSSFVPIGGWLILILIGLAITPIIAMAQLYNGHYFSISKWNTFMTGSTSVAFRAMLVFELAGYIFMACYSVFCLVLMLKRRDILPKCIVIYYISGVIFFLIDYVFALAIGLNSDSLGFTLVRTMIVAGIWIAYFKKSSRVEETFIIPYPPHNYTYEE
jgi:Domain of Unknown Function with PDB structure (DUF3857)/Protein of unknown function (DUF2569)/Transglutaminase-like superfamily